MKKFIIPVVVISLLLSVVACNGSSGGSTPAPIPQIVSNVTYRGNVADAPLPTSVVMVVSGLAATITMTNTEGSGSITGTFNANVATSVASVANTTCYNGLISGAAVTMTNCLYLATTNTFTGSLVFSQTPVAITLVAS